MTIFMIMNSFSVAELKTHAPRILRRVEQGESCLVTRHNRPVARLLPVVERRNKTQPGFDPQVRFTGDLTEPVMDSSEWGDLAF